MCLRPCPHGRHDRSTIANPHGEDVQRRLDRLGNFVPMSDQAALGREAPQGFGRLPRDLTEDEPSAAPILRSADTLLIDDLTVDEDESFAAALNR